jgi:hypothetical protein
LPQRACEVGAIDDSIESAVSRWIGVKFSCYKSHKTLEVIKALWRSDPLNPTIDHNMADMLLRANAQILAEIRLIGETRLRPVGPTFVFAIR